MNYRQAIQIIDYWNKNNFAGRVKTKEVIMAEMFLQDPERFLSQTSKTIGQKYTRLSRFRKSKNS